MNFLNRILWLKCRLTERAYSQTHGTIMATAAMLVFAFTGMALFSLFLGMQLLTLPPRQARELLHISLGAVWLFWVTFPLFGYRVNESLDVTRLFLYPISGFAVFLGSFIGNLLELATVLVGPIFFAVAIAVSPSWEDVPAAMIILGVFLLHTIAASQLLLSLLLHTLKDRRVADRMMVAVPLLMAFGVWAFEFGFFVSGAGGALLKLDVSSTSVWFPSGWTAETLLALSRGDWPALGYDLAVLTAITLLTVYFASRASEWMLTRGDTSAPPRSQRAAPTDGQIRWYSRLAGLAGNPRIAALAVKEMKLLSREPQVRLVLVLFTMMLCGAVAAGLLLVPASERDVLAPTIAFSLVFFFSGLLFNTFSLERTGLRFIMTAPVDPLVLFVGKNLGYWAFVTSLMAGSVLLLGLVFQTTLWKLAFDFISAQGLLFALLGVGNFVSVMSPYRLPSKGLLHQHRLPFGQVLWISFIGMIGLSVSGLVSSVTWMFLLPPLTSGHWKELVEYVALCGIFALGCYTMLTVLAARLFTSRSEKILAAVID